MKKILRELFKAVTLLYPYEKGKYSIISKIYLPYLAPKKEKYQVVKTYNDVKFKINLSRYVEANLFLYKCYELPTVRFITRLVNKDFTFFDIGGHIGFMSVTFSKNVKQVFTFEAEPNNYNDLLSNIKLNGIQNIFPNNVAVTNENKKLSFFLGEGKNSGIHSTIYNDSLSQKEIQVNGITIDSFIEEKNISKVDLIKIDIEGAEMNALIGMKKLLVRDQPILIIELVAAHQNLNCISIKTFKQFLAQFGYQSYKISKSGLLIKSTVDEFHLAENIVFASENKIPSKLLWKN